MIFALRVESGKHSKRLADYPTAYGVTVVPETPFLIIPQVSSERREYVPIGWLEPPVIPSEKLRLLPDATLADFALLTSTMHMAWMRTVTGRMKNDYMYSIGRRLQHLPHSTRRVQTYRNWNRSLKPCSTPVPTIRTQLYPTFTIPT